MSEEKLYVIKSRSDDNFYFSGDRAIPNWSDNLISRFGSYEIAKEIAEENNGQPVTFVEEPEKVTVSPNEAQAIESLLNADTYADVYDPFQYLFTSRYKKDIKRLIKAINNGYTVAKEKKYRVITPKSWWVSENEPEYMHMNVLNGIENYKGADDDTVFTQKQLDLYELNGAPFTKEEVTDDEQ